MSSGMQEKAILLLHEGWSPPLNSLQRPTMNATNHSDHIPSLAGDHFPCIHSSAKTHRNWDMRRGHEELKVLSLVDNSRSPFGTVDIPCHLHLSHATHFMHAAWINRDEKNHKPMILVKPLTDEKEDRNMQCSAFSHSLLSSIFNFTRYTVM